jgi:hypothetical protein
MDTRIHDYLCLPYRLTRNTVRSALTARQFKPVKVIGNAIGLILAIIYFACFWLILFTILS